MDSVTKRDNDELLRRYLIDNDEKCYEELFLNNINLIYFTIKKYFNFVSTLNLSLTEEDLFSVGGIGLDTAIKTFDKEKIGEIKFSTYAINGIRLAIIREVRNYKNDNKISYFSEVINPNTQDEGDLILLEDTLASDEDVEEFYYNKYKKSKVKEVVSKLDDKDRLVASLYYGIGVERKNQQEIANILGVSRSYVAMLLKNINKKLAIELKEFSSEYMGCLENDRNIKKHETFLEKKKTFFSLFPNKSVEEVTGALKKLPLKYSHFISLYYGLNYMESLDYDDIYCRYGVLAFQVDAIVNDGVAKIKEILGIKDVKR